MERPALSVERISALIVVVVLAGVLGAGYYAIHGADPGDVRKVFGSAVGSFLGAAAALVLFWLNRAAERQRKRDETARLKQALWHDVALTLPALMNEFDYWVGLRGQEAPRVAKIRPVEHLRPTIFDANLSKIGDLDAAERHDLHLFHDNLRPLREYISAFDKDEAAATETVEAIVDLLADCCHRGERAMAALDRDGGLRRALEASMGRATYILTDEARDRLARIQSAARESPPGTAREPPPAATR